MNKIKITLTTDKLRELNKAWELLASNEAFSPEIKVMQDICERLAVKFKKLYLEKEMKAEKKDFSLKLFYAEAYFLYRALSNYLYEINVVDTPYEYNIIFRLINYLHQKLI